MSISEEVRKKILAPVKDFFALKDNIPLVILYGSACREDFTEKSDVDLALAAQAPIPVDLMAEYQQSLELLLDREVDLIDLKTTKGLIFYKAVTGGIRIKNNPSLFVRLLSEALYFYEDYLPLVKRTQEYRIKRFIDGT